MDKKISYVVYIIGDFYPHYKVFESYDEAKEYYEEESKYLAEGYSVELHQQELLKSYLAEEK